VKAGFHENRKAGKAEHPMSKRPTVDLMALTSEQATTLPEAVQRAAVSTANLEGLSFKVPPEFRKRFRRHAAEADLKLNELLFAALNAWEREQALEKRNS